MKTKADVMECITTQTDNWEKLGHPAMMERFLIRNADVVWVGAECKVERGTPKECFRNATIIAAPSPYLVYCEGYGIKPEFGMLMHHAWLWDTRRDVLIDTTWGETSDTAYIGVSVDTQTLCRELANNQHYGVLDSGFGLNMEFMLKRDPDLIESVPDSLIDRVRRAV